MKVVHLFGATNFTSDESSHLILVSVWDSETASFLAFMFCFSHMIVYHLKGNPTIERFLMDKCSSSVHFALQVNWFLEAALEDAMQINDKKAIAFRKRLLAYCEASAVNGPSLLRDGDAIDVDGINGDRMPTNSGADDLAQAEGEVAQVKSEEVSIEQQKVFFERVSTRGKVRTIGIDIETPLRRSPIDKYPTENKIRRSLFRS